MRQRHWILLCSLIVAGAFVVPQATMAGKRDRDGAKKEKAEDGEKKKKKRPINKVIVESARKRHKEIAKLHDEIVALKREVKVLKAGAEDDRERRKNERKIKTLESKIERSYRKLERAVGKVRKPLDRDLKKLREKDAMIEAKVAKGRNQDKWLQEQAVVTGKLRSLNQSIEALEYLAAAKIEDE